MALPFSAVPTDYRVESGSRSWWANCAWDALAIPRLLGLDDAVVRDLGDPVRRARVLAVESGALVDTHGFVHFCVPAARWWDDIVFT